MSDPHHRHPNHVDQAYTNGTGTLPDNGVSASAREGSQRHARVLTVDEAFKYTPLTSINPFNADIIPIPFPAPLTLYSSALDRNEQITAKTTLESLDREAAAAQRSSARLARTMDDLKMLLRPEDLKEYKFKPPSLARQAPPPANANTSTVNGHAHSRPPSHRVGVFAANVLEDTNVDFAYSDAARDASGSRNPTAPLLNRNITSAGATTSITNMHADPERPSKSSQPLVMIPLPPLNPSSFTPHPTSKSDGGQEQSETTKKRKRESEEAAEILKSAGADGRDRSQAALLQLQEVMISVFEAEDMLEPDTSGNISLQSQSHFEPAPHGGDGQYVLNAGALSRLNNALGKAATANSLQHVSVDHLSRVQKLCHAIVVDASSTELQLTDDALEDQLQQWSQSIETADSSMLASRAFLRVMAAGRHEKELYSEEMLNDVLQHFKTVTETLIIQVVERRLSSTPENLAHAFSESRTVLGSILQRAGRVLRHIGDLLLKVDLSESSLTTVEDISTKLVFVENSPSEKESLVGLQKFETLRRCGMDVLTRRFLRCPEQRASILDEILSSLEKLPVTRQSARQYKIVDGKPIQLVSALIMQLVQTTAIKVPEKPTGPVRQQDLAMVESDEDESVADPSPTKRRAQQPGDGEMLFEGSTPADQVKTLTRPLANSVQKTASHVAKYLVNRAMKSSKTGDEPYRNLLDIFTEDFVNVLGLPEWPAAEMLLKTLLSQFIHIMDNEKSPAPAKNMALDLMGVMGSGIADLRRHLEKSINTVEGEEPSSAQSSASLAENYLNGESIDTELLLVNGPFRTVYEYLHHRSVDDLQVQNARDYCLLQWAVNIWTIATPEMDEESEDHKLNPAAKWLMMLIREPDSLDKVSDLGIVSSALAQLAYSLTVLNMTFCRALPRLFSTLLRALSSVHATVRSRSLKSVIQLLEKDPSMLDRSNNIMAHILRAASDASTMVRDSALGLIGKCISLKPALELQCLDTIVTRSVDAAVGVRKRSIKLLKDVYLSNGREEVCLTIAAALLRRMNDDDESVVELARQSLEEVWMVPFYSAVQSEDLSIQSQQAIQKQARYLVSLVDYGKDISDVLEPFFKNLLKKDISKSSKSNRKVLEAIVSTLFEQIIENEQGRGTQQKILRMLTILAKSAPKLFAFDQLKTLEPYTRNLQTHDDVVFYYPVISIFRHVLPFLSAMQHGFLVDVQTTLLSSLPKLPSAQLVDETTMCLWAIDGVLNNTTKLVKVCVSIVAGSIKEGSSSGSGSVARIKKYLTMTGHFGKAWALDAYASEFQAKFTWWKGGSVADLLVDTILPFADADRSSEIRQTALESLCLVCQSWPKNYLRQPVVKAIESALKSRDKNLELAVISGFRNFLAIEESKSKVETASDAATNPASGAERLGQSMVLSDNDGAATSLAQQFLSDILRLALSSIDERALVATEVICSTNRQGLVHPRESGIALVALETSPNKEIARMAFAEHMNLNAKHESILEKEYLKAIEQAFAYQRDTVQDSSGLDTLNEPKLALFFEVLKSGSIATRKKVLTNLCKRLDFNIANVNEIPDLEGHFAYSKFLSQNLALADYGRTDEVIAVGNTLENIFSTTGTALSQHIETFASENKHDRENINLELLRRLTLASMILSLFWQTRSHLHSVWPNVQWPSALKLHNGKGSINKDKQKDASISKVPSKSLNAAKYEQTYLQATETVGALVDAETMGKQCEVFMNLFAMDADAKVDQDNMDEEGEDTIGGRCETPSVVDGSVGSASVPASRDSQSSKRKRLSSAGLTPSSKQRGRPSIGRRKSSMAYAWDNDDGGWD